MGPKSPVVFQRTRNLIETAQENMADGSHIEITLLNIRLSRGAQTKSSRHIKIHKDGEARTSGSVTMEEAMKTITVIESTGSVSLAQGLGETVDPYIDSLKHATIKNGKPYNSESGNAINRLNIIVISDGNDTAQYFPDPETNPLLPMTSFILNIAEALHAIDGFIFEHGKTRYLGIQLAQIGCDDLSLAKAAALRKYFQGLDIFAKTHGVLVRVHPTFLVSYVRTFHVWDFIDTVSLYPGVNSVEPTDDALLGMIAGAICSDLDEMDDVLPEGAEKVEETSNTCNLARKKRRAERTLARARELEA
ncbi:hypothetical protein DFH09DRAFT_1091168 [Mycena vulgaris]|nr:hypothetical protein DFH09DRAFT_1091168 [Mycena vulgaris]